MERLSITDQGLWQKAEAAIIARAPFEIEISAGHRHYRSFLAMLEAIQGYPDKRSAWRKFWDALYAADLFAVWGEAVQQHGYDWSWRKDAHAVVVSFSPDARWRKRETGTLLDRIDLGTSMVPPDEADEGAMKKSPALPQGSVVSMFRDVVARALRQQR